MEISKIIEAIRNTRNGDAHQASPTDGTVAKESSVDLPHEDSLNTLIKKPATNTLEEPVSSSARLTALESSSQPRYASADLSFESVAPKTSCGFFSYFKKILTNKHRRKKQKSESAYRTLISVFVANFFTKSSQKVLLDPIVKL
ncbi:hypothetical protein HELRODRAFT_169069 [Helobdella robusta]|uniref:Uncharacterized protein n=1 Tax=Helobdella robusta TaxID=6412 RepID=T1F1D0_HELRO|nr:hypothetical protein HELRODRAFT_169069 [Helobdella robusta]ESO09128.1 hypothetical protein HELRODRAFT_169069 [Helobdella robusta]